jgi:hypothetical protein
VEEIGVGIHTQKSALWWTPAEVQEMVVSGKQDYLKAMEAAKGSKAPT